MPPRRSAVVALLLALSLGAAACSSGSTASTSTTTASIGTGLGGTSDTQTPSANLTGAGASSAQPFLTRSFYDYAQVNPKVTVNYDPAGSSVGISDLQSATVDFGQSEIPMTADEIAKASGGAVLQVPIDLGGVAVSYNVPGAPKNLRLNGDQLAGIYLGTLTDWHQVDSAIPSGTAIVAVHRADSSGPGYDLDQYLIATSPTWVAATGTSKPSKTWPKTNIGVGEQLNSGVAKYVKQTPGAIGFIEYAYAAQNGFTNASLLNKAGRYVAPSTASIAAAGAYAANLSSTNYNIVNGPGAATYPLANFSWTLLYERQRSTDKGIALGKLLNWIATTGQSVAPSLGYAPLPTNAVALTHSTLMSLEDANGKALFSQ